MKNVLVSGAGGYIGSTLVDLLLEAGHRVIGLDRYFFGTELLGDTLRHPRFALVNKDVRDVAESDFQKVDAVFDLAALSNDPSGEIDEQITYDINHRARARAAALAKKAGVRQYTLASSCSVYGSGGNSALTEESEPHPITTYAKANVLAERDLFALADDRFSVTALRQATVFGLSKRMRFDLAVNIMTLNAIQKGKIFVTGGGTQWRPFIHVRDTASAFVLLLDRDAKTINRQVFNVGSSEFNFNILSLAYIVRENIPFPVEVEVVPDDTDKRNYNVSFDKIKSVLGFEPKRSPSDGVKEIYAAIKQGRIDLGPRTVTVKWYKYLLEAKTLIDGLVQNGRLL